MTTRFEYKVVPAPNRGVKRKGLRDADARFAAAITEVMNELAAEGWEYLRTDTLPCEERKGLRGRVSSFKTMLVFRRAVAAAHEPVGQATMEAPAAAQPAAGVEQAHRREPVLRGARQEGGAAAPLGPANAAPEGHVVSMPLDAGRGG